MNKRVVCGVAAVALAVGSVAWGKKPRNVLEVPTGEQSRVAAEPGVLFNGWGLTPAGVHVGLKSMPLKMVVSPDKRYVAAVCGGTDPGLGIIDANTKQVVEWVGLPRAWNGVAFSKDGRQIYVSGGNSNAFYVFEFQGGKARLAKTLELDAKTETGNFFAGVVVHPTTGNVFVCNEAKHEVWQVRPADGRVVAKFRTGEHPHSAVFAYSPRYLMVSNWGDRTVSVIDIGSGKTVQRINVGIRPNDMAIAPDGRVFVACAGDNTVHVIETKNDAAAKEKEEELSEAAPPPASALEIISTALYPGGASPEGSTPCGVAVSPDGKVLFVVNADNNDVMVVDISKEDASVVQGFVPTGWYPTAVATDGKRLLVANGKGLGNLGPNTGGGPYETPRVVGGVTFNHPTGMIEGSVSIVDEPTLGDLAKYTEQVRKNCPFTPEAFRQTRVPSDSIIPSKVGGECPIKYVLYVIKENRTYDQVFGDMKDASGNPIGNGDPKLTLFGEDVSPNHHQLARDYVLLDNLYCNSEVSQDGHSWCDGAIATDYRQRAWTVGYTRHGRLPGNEDMDNPSGGYLWDLCRRHGVTFKSYGEMVKLIPSANRGTWAGGRDKDRIELWIKDLKKAEETGGELPRLMVMSLGEDHTRGTAPGEFTPQAHVASNDIAVGKIVEAASRSKFWNEMAIFMIEDDAQNGPDHVDSHRTVGLVISPWCKRRVVDSTAYSTASMIRTMELILGLPPMTQYDAGATPMFNCFAKVSNPVPYVRLQPKVDVNARNTKNAPGAAASARMDFDEWDEAPEDELNRILWAAIKGVDSPYPTPRHGAVFVGKAGQD